jgi:hypothetical protein
MVMLGAAMQTPLSPEASAVARCAAAGISLASDSSIWMAITASMRMHSGHAKIKTALHFMWCCAAAGVESTVTAGVHSFIHVTPVAEAHLSNASPFQTPLITPNNKLIKPTNKDNFLPG